MGKPKLLFLNIQSVRLFKRYFNPRELFVKAAFLTLSLSTFALAIEVDRLTSPADITGACFGCSVAVSGNTLVVGEPGGALQGSIIISGVVNVYEWNGTDFILQQRLTPNDLGHEDRFGESVDIQGNTIVVGSARDDVSTDDNRGSAYVYVKSGATWIQQAKIQPNDLNQLAWFGASVSISGETVLIGAPGRTDIVSPQQIGTAYVYTRSGTTWTQQGKLDPSDGAVLDAFGFSVDLSNDTALIGSPSGPTPAGANTGVAYVYVRNGTTWSFQQKLSGNLISPLDQFGASVALENNTAVVGSPFDDVVNVGTDAGSFYIFTRNGTTWTEQQKILSPEGAAGTLFGRKVAIHGEVASAVQYQFGQTVPAALRTFRRTNNTWSFLRKYQATVGSLGTSLAMDDQFILGAGFGGLTVVSLHVVVFRMIAGLTPFDYDGDGKSDPSVFRASNGTWYVSRSGLGDMYVMPWGLAGDNIVPADYDGDGKTDLAVRRPADNNFYIFNSSNSTMEVRNFGISGDIALPSDYNGDGKADVAVWRPSNGTWYLSLSGSGIFYVMPWGLAADKPVPGDYDGDGKTDLAVFRPTEGRWYMFNTVTGAFSTNDFGMNGDTPVQADYSGDGKTDFAVYRASNNTWYRQHTNDGTFNVSQWGLAGDFPTPGDFDGDGRTDVAVWRPSNGTWYVLKSTSGVFTQSFGTSGDTPTPNAFVY